MRFVIIKMVDGPSVARRDVLVHSATCETDGFELLVLAGGVGALEPAMSFLRLLPTSCQAAVVFAAASDEPAAFVRDKLARVSPFVVADAANRLPVAPGMLWLAPRDRHLRVTEARTFAFAQDRASVVPSPSLNMLLDSAAAVYRNRMLAVMLSGDTDDGVGGAQSVDLRGGTVIVQAPATSQAPSLPLAVVQQSKRHLCGTIESFGEMLRQAFREPRR